MALSGPETRRVSLLPDGATPCVWMRAGLVAFKLCARDGDCDGCPFDRAMRGVSSHGPTSRPLQEGWFFPDDRHYHRFHGWMKPCGPRRLRLGVDALVASLVGPPASVVLPSIGARLERGQVACWLLEHSAPIAIRSPVSGTVRRRNELVQHQPQLVSTSPYEEGWLVEVDPGQAPAEAEEPMSAEEARSRASDDLARFLHVASAHLAKGQAAVGPTLSDGGERLTGLQRMLGIEHYCKLIQHFLS